jgi:uncharacterized protein YjbJ (UPF0337 family)
MITRQELEGNWNQVKGRIQTRWGNLTDDELQRVRGDANELVGVIQQRTGETRRSIEEFLRKAVEEGESMAHQAMESARHYADQASAAARRGYEEATAQFSAGMDQAEAMVRRRPMESLVAAFGAGLVAGVVTGLILRSR